MILRFYRPGGIPVELRDAVCLRIESYLLAYLVQQFLEIRRADLLARHRGVRSRFPREGVERDNIVG